MSGILYIVSAPSGAGKTTLVRALLKEDPSIRLSVSFTTRTAREGEVDGVSYNFVSRERFFAMRDGGEFLEWAEVHGNFYATSRPWLEEQLAAGQDVLLEIDWQGAAQVCKLFPSAVSIFILPPSFAVLEQRLRGRGTDSTEVIERRLAAARDEMRRVADFDYAIINNDLQTAMEDLRSVTRAARLRTPQTRLRHPAVFVDNLGQ
ncbi:guanylate kinase [Viridibacterium curvum]|uniref:Guanylate kinase n=1 Tax=Viridibacterium curvum TaxID=1101404 RepID=A0ABP9QLV1_9RHOO